MNVDLKFQEQIKLIWSDKLLFWAVCYITVFNEIYIYIYIYIYTYSYILHMNIHFNVQDAQLIVPIVR